MKPHQQQFQPRYPPHYQLPFELFNLSQITSNLTQSIWVPSKKRVMRAGMSYLKIHVAVTTADQVPAPVRVRSPFSRTMLRWRRPSTTIARPPIPTGSSVRYSFSVYYATILMTTRTRRERCYRPGQHPRRANAGCNQAIRHIYRAW
jgi:hypothetical protein